MSHKKTTSAQKMGNSINSSSVFKPLIASSLALALSANIGYAQAADSNSSGYYYATGSTSEAYAASKGGSDPWGTASVSNGILTVDWTTTYSNDTITSIQTKNAQINVGGSKHLKIAKATKANFVFENSFLNFADTTYGISVANNNTTVTARFAGGLGQKSVAGVTYNNVALYGTLTFAMSQGSNVTFSQGANMIGGVVLYSSSGTAKSTLNFTGGGNLIATDQSRLAPNANKVYYGQDIQMKNQAVYMRIAGGSDPVAADSILNINFGESGKVDVVNSASDIVDENGVIKTKLIGSEVSAVEVSNISSQVDKTIITNMIKGELTAGSYASFPKQRSIAYINFYNNGLIDGNVLADEKGTFNISFAQKGKITGSVKGKSDGINTVNFGSNTQTAEISSGVLAFNSSSNTISASKDLVIGTISGDSDGGNGYSLYLHNNGGNSNTLDVTSGKLTTKSGIRATYGTNKITANSLEVQSGGLFTLGDGGTSYAKNILAITNNADIIGNITATNAAAKNYVTAGSINVSGQIFAQNGGSRNFIKITGASNSINTVQANNGYNIISLDGSNQTLNFTKISVGDLSSKDSFVGKNYIAKGIAITPTGDSSSKELELSFTESDWSQSKYQASVNLVTTDVASKSGQNYINVTSFQANGGIATTSGQNNINANTLSVSGLVDANGGTNNLLSTKLSAVNIRARWNGRNNIVITRNQTSNFSGAITAGSTERGDSGNNYISFADSAIANFASTSSLSAGNGANYISLSNDGANTLSFTTISSTSANGKNYLAKSIITGSNSNLTLASGFEGSWADSTYQANGVLNVGEGISAVNGKNFISVSEVQVNGTIDSNGTSVNNIAATTFQAGNITARWAGVNNIVISNQGTFTGNINAGQTDNSGNNYIYFADSAVATFNNVSSLSAKSGANYISLGNTATTNNLSISTISALDGGTNYLAKNILSNSNGNLATQTINTNDWWASDTNAFEGSLSVGSVTSSGSGANYISYKATNSATSAIISNLVTSEGDTPTTTLGTAISGSNNNIYLNVSGSGLSSGVDALQATAQNPASATQLKNATVILGNVNNSGTTNIKIVGTQNNVTPDVPGSKTITNKNQIGILGNINTTSGTTNVVLQDTFFAPSAIIVDNAQPSTGKTTMPFGGANAGNITTASGAITNVVTRFTTDVKPTGVSMYSVNGAGTTNIAIQGNIDVGTYINYSNGSHVNLIFANASNGSDNFSTTADITSNSILGVTYQNGVKLSIADKTILIGDNNASFLDTYASYYSDGSTPLATVWANRTDTKDTVAISGLVVGNISNLGMASGGSVTSKTYDVTLKSGSAFAGNINLNSSTTTAINIVMEENSKLILSDAEDGNSSNLFVISNLDIKNGEVDQYQLQTETLKQTNNVINIATGGAGANNVATRENFRLLAIGNTDASGTSQGAKNTGLYGNGAAVFMTYVNTNARQDIATLGGVSSSGKTTGVATRAGNATDGQYGNLYSDRIIIANIGDNTTAQTGTYYMQFAVDADSKLNSVTYNASNDNQASGGGTKTAGNIAVLTVVNTTDTNSAGITLKTQDVLQGFDRIGGDLIAVETDITGEAGTDKKGYTTYFINTLNTRGATEATQDVTASAFATNYDLYFANFNSLNKRMGELRDNDNSQGAWARIFNGSQSNDFTKSKSTYTTFQGGYDYAFGFEGANNYLGVALSYAMSSSTSDLNALDINGSTKGIDNIKSSAVEVALYNSYVQDEGWYNDTIAKFSYIMSDFTITGQESKYNTSNMAFTLSDEFGYRFKLGSEKEWYIDPQLEVALGYFNQSDFVQTLGLSSLEGVADGIITTRARFGSSFGYDFKKFTANKPIKASVYVGAFYEYDYITGGDVTLTTNLGGVTTSSSAVSSDGRVVMNVGTNMTIKDNTRIYFDFESSFAGKINTDYQVNVGVRYSFGENTGYTPMTAKKEVAPLKVSEEKAEESKEIENTENNTQEKSTENKTEEKKAQ